MASAKREVHQGMIQVQYAILTAIATFIERSNKFTKFTMHKYAFSHIIIVFMVLKLEGIDFAQRKQSSGISSKMC